jgi:anion-transporting  ArsA/GET3 family ATPase
MLSLPAAIVRAVSDGRMKDEAAARFALLSDSERCAVIPVSIMEELPVNETIAMVTSLLKNKIPLFALVLNKIIEDCNLSYENMVILKNKSANALPNWALAISVNRNRCHSQAAGILKLKKELALSFIMLPELNHGFLDRHSIDRLVEDFKKY